MSKNSIYFSTFLEQILSYHVHSFGLYVFEISSPYIDTHTHTHTHTLQYISTSVFLFLLFLRYIISLYVCSILGNRWDSVGLESACSAGDLGLIPGSGRSPGKGNGNPLQYSCLENSMNRGAWQVMVHGITKVRHDLVT